MVEDSSLSYSCSGWSQMENTTVLWDIGRIWRRLEPLERIYGCFPLADPIDCFAPVPNLGNLLYRFQQHPLNGHKLAWKPHRKEETHNLSKVSRFLLQSFTFVSYRSNCFFLPHKSLYFERYATLPMVIFWAWATCDDSCGMCMDCTARLHEKHELALLSSCANLVIPKQSWNASPFCRVVTKISSCRVFVVSSRASRKQSWIMACGQWSNISRWPCVILYTRYLNRAYFCEKKAKFRGIFRGKFVEKSDNFAGKKSKFAEKSADLVGFSREKSQNSPENRSISRDFREKYQILKDFHGQILRKIDRFHGKFRGETSPRNNQ